MKRIAFKAAWLIIFGAIANVALAWALLFRSPVVPSFGQPSSDQQYVREWSPNGLHTIITIRIGELLLAQSMTVQPVSTATMLEAIDAIRFNQFIPSWSAFCGQDPVLAVGSLAQPSDVAISSIEHSSGWPMLAFRYSQVRRSVWGASGIDELIETSNGINLPQSMQRDLRYALPIVPIWPGFVVNTLLYAGVSWCVLFMPGALRRRWRLKRGLCINCGYPIGKSEVCTECGTRLPNRKSRVEC